MCITYSAKSIKYEYKVQHYYHLNVYIFVSYLGDLARCQLHLLI